MTRKSISRRINQDILLTFTVVTLLFVAIGFFMQMRWRNDNIHTVFHLLDTIVAREQDNLANELFEQRINALKLRLQEIVAIEHVSHIGLYDQDRQRMTGVVHPGDQAETDRLAGEQPAGIEDLASTSRYRVEGVFKTFVFSRPITAAGDILGWIVIA